MDNKQTIFLRITSKDLSKVLCSMSKEELRDRQLIFPDGMIESFCEKENYACYRFAYNEKGQPYMRAKIYRITLEYLVVPNYENNNIKEARVTQIFKEGQRIYVHPNNPAGLISVLY